MSNLLHQLANTFINLADNDEAIMRRLLRMEKDNGHC